MYPDNDYSVVRLKNFFELRSIFHNFSITIDTKQGSYYFDDIEKAAMFFGDEENFIIENIFAPIDGDIETNGKHIHIGVSFASSASMDKYFKVKTPEEIIKENIVIDNNDNIDSSEKSYPYPPYYEEDTD
jgi:hypothetical protein